MRKPVGPKALSFAAIDVGFEEGRRFYFDMAPMCGVRCAGSMDTSTCPYDEVTEVVHPRAIFFAARAA